MSATAPKVVSIILFLTVVLLVVWFVSDGYIRSEQSNLPMIKSFSNEKETDKTVYRFNSEQVSQDLNVVELLIQQRNNASKKANLLQQKIGQMQCENLAKLPSEHTSRTGGWCLQESKEDSGKHVTDNVLAEGLAELFKGTRVASFGDGPGRYKQLIEDSGKHVTYDAYDGAPYCEETSKGRVKFLDLTLPQYGLPMYDWVISLEVAEHIPGEYESVYIDNIHRHARVGVVLSWAVPGQGGYAHINNRPFDYVVSIMKEKGLYHNPEKSDYLKTTAQVDWLKRNINVYMRRNSTKSDFVEKLFI
ncbi:hypothetical protein CHS0354_031111 [Potamilus streckersoni]|uniref:Uncharacterized protein n=1 Tax=Potamilus streckersoni TaxID=2493646 RepID=A0AAE0TCZ6_9BIVA|nr:hypothetical protein CHS0354_031111 [Potamilus streckersoni]